MRILSRIAAFVSRRFGSNAGAGSVSPAGSSPRNDRSLPVGSGYVTPLLGVTTPRLFGQNYRPSYKRKRSYKYVSL